MIYKFYSNMEYAKEVIVENELYLSSVDQFNDPYERLLVFNRQIDSEGNPFELPNLMYSAISNSVGICCFTTNWDSMLMWSYYGDSHKGICIGFQIDEAETALIHSTPVYIDLGLSNTLCFQRVSYEKKMFTLNYSGGFFAGGDEVIFSVANKTSDYKIENEIRLVCLNESRLKIHLRPEMVKKCIFGAHASIDDIAKFGVVPNNVSKEQIKLSNKIPGRLELKKI